LIVFGIINYLSSHYQQRNPWFFPCIKGGAEILFLFFRRGKNFPFLGGRGDLKQQKEEINE